MPALVLQPLCLAMRPPALLFGHPLRLPREFGRLHCLIGRPFLGPDHGIAKLAPNGEHDELPHVAFIARRLVAPGARHPAQGHPEAALVVVLPRRIARDPVLARPVAVWQQAQAKLLDFELQEHLDLRRLVAALVDSHD